jgi:prohibitin 2
MRRELLALAAILLLTGCAVVEPGARGIKKSLGRVDAHLYQPGIVAYNPLTDAVAHMNIQQQTLEGECRPLTADQQQIVIKYRVQFRCPESQLMNLYQNYSGDPYSSLVDPQIQEAFRQVVANHKADIVTKELTVIKNQVLSSVRENVKGLVDVVDIPITHIDLPQVLQDAISQKQVMEQQSLQKQYELDKANKEAQITIANATALAKSIQMQSDALQKSPSLIEYEKVKKWNGVLPQTVLGASGTLFQMK